MTINIQVWSDFVCPWCFLVSTSLVKLRESHHVDVIWRAYQLRPPGTPPMSAQTRARIEAMRPQFEAMAKRQYGIDLQRGPMGVNSRLALTGSKYAEEQGNGAAYHQAVFVAYWQQGRNIEDRTVLAEIAEEVGMDRDDFLACLSQPRLTDSVDQDIRQAREYAISGVPALVFNERFLIPGAQPYDELVRVVEQIQSHLKPSSS